MQAKTGEYVDSLNCRKLSEENLWLFQKKYAKVESQPRSRQPRRLMAS